MKITNLKLKLNKKEDSIIKAFLTLVLDDNLAIHNLRIIEGKDRLFVSFPDQKIKEKFVDIVHPINSEFREYIESEILKEYQNQKNN